MTQLPQWPSEDQLTDDAAAVGIWRAIRGAVWEASLPTTEKIVALQLLEYLPNIEPSVEGIAKKTSLSERAVRDALRALEGHQIVITMPRPGQRSTYRFTNQPDVDSHGRPRQLVPPTPEPTAPLELSTPAAGAPLTPAAGAPKAVKIKAEKRERVPRAPKAEHSMPEDWKPTKDHIAFAKDNRINLANEEFKFRGWADGRKVLSWNGRFATWLGGAVDRIDSRPTGASATARRDDEPIRYVR